jgi:carboxypeptidase C (cathepsin A)
MRRVFWLILVVCWLPLGSFAADEKLSIERRSATVEGRTLNYRSTAGMLVVGEPSGPQARAFFTAYELEGGDAAQRPLAFAFNGGPGAASAYLHVGAMGPRRVAFNDDGSIPPPPQRMVDNELSWLGFTDMVFVDPVGTGFSRAQKSEGKDGEKDADSSFWGVQDDVQAQARFIRLYLTRSNRWSSPKFLVGESYGGFRVALLSDALPSNYGVGLSGVVLISPALQFAVTRPDAFDVLPWALRLPALAAVASHHGRSSIAKPASGLDRDALAAVEAWSLDSYLPALARGGSLAGPAREAMFDRLAEFTGMPKETVRRRKGKIGSGEFVKQVLRDTGRVPSLYDGALIALDPDPESPTPQRGDLGLDQITAALLSPFNAYVRDELKYETDQPYLMLNSEVNAQWRWRGGRGQGYAGSAESLRNAMTLNPKLKVLVAHGLFDLVTPYFASVYILDQLQLEPPLKDNLTFRAYAAGHMMYTHAAARAALYRDAKAVFEGAGR